MSGVERQHYNVTFTLLAVAAVAYALLQSLVAPALLTIQEDLHTTTAGAAWILTAYLLSASVVTPIAGRLGDMVDQLVARVGGCPPVERRRQAHVHGGRMVAQRGKGGRREDHRRAPRRLVEHRPPELGQRPAQLQLVERVAGAGHERSAERERV